MSREELVDPLMPELEPLWLPRLLLDPVAPALPPIPCEELPPMVEEPLPMPLCDEPPVVPLCEERPVLPCEELP